MLGHSGPGAVYYEAAAASDADIILIEAGERQHLSAAIISERAPAATDYLYYAKTDTGNYSYFQAPTRDERILRDALMSRTNTDGPAYALLMS